MRGQAHRVVARARIDQRRALALQQAGVALLRRPAPVLAGQGHDVDVVLQPVGQAEVPHRQAEHVLVGRVELLREAHGALPVQPLFVGGGLRAQHRELGIDHGGVEGRQVERPDVEGADLGRGVALAQPLQEMLRRVDRARARARGRGLDVEDRRSHAAQPSSVRRPTVPATTSAMQARRGPDSASPKASTPISTTPTEPMPVHTA